MVAFLGIGGFHGLLKHLLGLLLHQGFQTADKPMHLIRRPAGPLLQIGCLQTVVYFKGFKLLNFSGVRLQQIEPGFIGIGLGFRRGGF